MINLKIDPEFQNQIPPLRTMSTSSLKKISSRKASCSLL